MKPEIKALLDKHNLTVESVFVPWSQSRNAEEKNPSLNWKVTLLKDGRKILTTDYSAGCAHAPSYKQKFDYDTRLMVNKECETGFAVKMMWSMGHIQEDKRKPIKPNIQDVIYSLLMDSDVLEYSGFESWASGFGYDTDSRQAEKIYQACMKIALQFRQIGESLIAELQEAYQDY